MSEDNRDYAPDFDRLVGKAEACKLLNTSFVTLWRAMKDGTLAPGRYVGNRLHWKLSELEAFRDGLPLDFRPGSPFGRRNPDHSPRTPATAE